MRRWSRFLWWGLVTFVLLLCSCFLLSSSVVGPYAQSPPVTLTFHVEINALPYRVYLPLILRSSGMEAFLSPRLSLRAASGADAFARSGSWLRYVLTLVNEDTTPTAPLIVTLTLPSEVRYCAACTPGWTDLGEHRYRLETPPLDPHERRTLILSAQVEEEQSVPGITALASQAEVAIGPYVLREAQTITLASTFTMGNTHAHPKGVAADPDRNLVYAAIHSTGELAVIDPVSGTLSYIHHAGMGTQAQGVAYLNDKIYLVHPDINVVAVISAGDLSLITTIPVGQAPFGIAAAGTRVYVSNFADNTVSVIDAGSDTVLTTTQTGGHPCLVAALGDRAYVANHSHFASSSLGIQALASSDPLVIRALAMEYAQTHPEDTGITVVHADGTTERILTGTIGFFGVAVDPSRGLVYATQRDFGQEGLYVISATNHSLVRHVPLSKPYAVAVNPNTHHVAVVMAQSEVNQLYVFDGNNDYALIRSEDLLQQSLPDGMMDGGQGIALLNDWFYVANYGDDSMTSLPDTPSTPPEYDPPIGAPFVRTWLYDLHQDGHRPLGLPGDGVVFHQTSRQTFVHGFVGGQTTDSLYWRDNLTGTDEIFLLKAFVPPYDGSQGRWLRFDDRWDPSQPVYACAEATSGYGVRFGFGIVWCDLLHSTDPAMESYKLGEPERPEWSGEGASQAFSGGMMLWSPALPELGIPGYIYVLYDDGTWHAYPY